MAMTMTESLRTGEMNYGGFADAIGGIATVVLAIVGLSGVHSDVMLAIATIVFGAALMVQGGALLSEYTHIIFPPGASGATTTEFSGGGIASLFLVGAAGIVLGVLALLGIYPAVLTAVAAITFGSALILSSKAVWSLHLMKQASMMVREPQDWQMGSEALAGEMASGSAGLQAFAGLAAVVLGILALVGTYPAVLTLVALLALGATIVMTGSALSGAVLSFMRPSSSHATRSTTTTSAFSGS